MAAEVAPEERKSFGRPLMAAWWRAVRFAGGEAEETQRRRAGEGAAQGEAGGKERRQRQGRSNGRWWPLLATEEERPLLALEEGALAARARGGRRRGARNRSGAGRRGGAIGAGERAGAWPEVRDDPDRWAPPVGERERGGADGPAWRGGVVMGRRKKKRREGVESGRWKKGGGPRLGEEEAGLLGRCGPGLRKRIDLEFP